MLYNLLFPLAGEYTFLNIFKYQTFRTGGAIMTSLIISFLLMPRFIQWLKNKHQGGQPIRTDGPSSHLLTKTGTPTMGGAMIIFAIVVSTLLWADIKNAYVWAVLLVTVGFGCLGAVDDYVKLTRQTHHGISARMKLLGQGAISLLAAMYFTYLSPEESAYSVALPFLKETFVYLGIFIIPWSMAVMIGSSNAVNLTDGLDGLAIVPVMIAAACFGLISYLVGHAVFADYLQLNAVPGAGEISIICGAVIGAGLGFLWFNAPPAMVFMGDTGSLAIGGMLGAISIVTKHELILSIIGGLFVLEAVSVILQVGYFKLTGKRIFLMAPIHHHFERKGWQEQTIVIRFWIIAVILALIGLSSLKLR